MAASSSVPPLQALPAGACSFSRCCSQNRQRGEGSHKLDRPRTTACCSEDISDPRRNSSWSSPHPNGYLQRRGRGQLPVRGGDTSTDRVWVGVDSYPDGSNLARRAHRAVLLYEELFLNVPWYPTPG